MVTFSVSGSDDGEGPSNRNYKRRRIFDSEEEEYEEAAASTEQEEEQEEEEERSQQHSQEVVEMENSVIPAVENDSNEANSSESNPEGNSPGQGQANDLSKSVSAIISDPDVLDCFICSEPLSIPIFQCENGHIACSKCCAELMNKCPMCSMPIGYNRCRAVEKLLESIKIACPNATYGCKDMFSCNMKSSHEKQCAYTPCRCPHTGCVFFASSKELALHFSHRHAGFRKHFTYDKFFAVSLNASQKEIVLVDQNDENLFIVHNKRIDVGNMVHISCLGPKAMESFPYDVMARYQGSTLILQSSTMIIQENNGGDPRTGSLVILSDSFGSGQLKLEIRIKSRQVSAED